jgi:hypothetical protein
MTISLVEIEVEKTLKSSLKGNQRNVVDRISENLIYNLSIYKVRLKGVSITVMSNDYYKINIRTDYKDYIYAVQLVFVGDEVVDVKIL